MTHIGAIGGGDARISVALRARQLFIIEVEPGPRASP
jgi:hypothetical protein